MAKKFLNQNTALCLVPHPDDAALSMAQLVFNYPDTEFNMVYFSAGTATDETAGQERIQEDKSFWNNFGTKNVVFTEIASCAFDESPLSHWLTAVEKQCKGYGVVFSPTPCDSHHEHVIVNRLLTPLSRSKPLTLVEYRSPSTNREWVPNLFIPLTIQQLQYKIMHLRNAFRSQLDSPYFTEDSLEYFHADFLSKKRGHNYVEMYNLKQIYF